MISTVIVSKDRPLQLDLLLRSLYRHGRRSVNTPTVIYKASTARFDDGYRLLEAAHPTVWFLGERDFQRQVKEAVGAAPDRVFMFLCDDDVLFAPPPDWIEQELDQQDQVLCVSLRLGMNTDWCYPAGRQQKIPGLRWSFADGEHDFGYPGSIDGHVFRTDDLRALLLGASFRNPTELEVALNGACLEQRKRTWMGGLAKSVLTTVPVNRTSSQSGVAFGLTFPQTAEQLLSAWLDGYRVDLERLSWPDPVRGSTELDLLSALTLRD